MIIDTVRSEEAHVHDTHAGYHQFHGELENALTPAEQERHSYGSFLIFWHKPEFKYDEHGEEAEEQFAPGWYWVAEFPGCLPDGEPSGPFATSRQALEDADPWHPEFDEYI